MLSATEALERLKEGNQHYLSDNQPDNSLTGRNRRDEVVSGQDPFAIILGCSDSRAPAEIIFNQGVGDLFVIRVAGNIVGNTQVGSIEYATEQFGTKLVLVMGHTHCGAVMATLEEMERTKPSTSPNIQSIVDHIRPGLESLYRSDPSQSPDNLLQEAVRENVRSSVKELRQSPLLGNLIQKEGLKVVGAEYSLESGKVDFFDEA